MAKRGANFGVAEDVYACKAYVRVSEDPVSGVGQKATDFKAQIHVEYVKMVKSHNARYNTSYAERSANSVFNRFKKMSRFSLKLIGIEIQIGDPPSGDTDKDEWEKQIKEAFVERVVEAGNMYESVIACKLFLEGIPKWRTWQEEEGRREEAGKKRVRSSGTKAAKQKEQDKRVIQGFLSGNSVDGSTIETQRQKHHKKTESFMVNVAQ